MSTKFRTLKFLMAALFLAVAAIAGCGGGSKTGNVVTIVVTPKGTSTSPQTVIVTQSITFSAIVSGSTNTNVTWACTYATRTFDTSGKPQDAAAKPCDANTGNIPSNSANTTVVFSAPENLPDPTKISGNNCTDPKQACFLLITLTATAAADTKKTDTTVILIDSGISVTLTPTTATVPTSSSATAQSQFQFNATLTNDIGTTTGVTWLVTQGTVDLAKGINFPQLATCSPTCGSIDANGLYSAPTAVPTTATVTLVATSKADITRFAIGTITITKGGPITYSGISPTVIPQGATSYDLYVFAPGITSASQVTLKKASDNSTQSFNFATGQLKVLFPIPTTKVTAPQSTGIRLRLGPADLQASDTYTVSVSDPSQTVTQTGAGPFSFSVLPVRPTSVVSSPDTYVQNSQSQQFSLLVNGGYFGSGGSFVQSSLLGNTVAADNTTSTSRRLNLQFTAANANNAQPGLYPLSVSRSLSPVPAGNSPSVTNFAVFPDYQNVTLTAGTSLAAGIDGVALVQPSAMDIDPVRGIVAVATTGLNRVDLFQISYNSGTNTATLVPFAKTATVNVPTSVSINRNLHQVAVVSFKDKSVSVFQIPTNSPGAAAIAPLATVSLAGIIPSAQTPEPFPYSIGVDSDTNHALVAYSSSANPTTAKVGFLLDLNSGGSDCIVTGQVPPNPTTSPCVSGQVTLNTGLYPQIAMLPHSHTAVVTPGGQGVANGIDVLKSSSVVPIASVSLTSGLVTVTTPAGKPHGLNPGNPGTVLIEGLPKGTTNNTEFNGAFTVQSVINANSFTYILNSTVNDTATGDADSFAYFGTPNVTIGGLSQTTQGVAVNPLTGLVAAADANATGLNGAQINLLNSLDQNVTSILFRAGCTAYTTPCSGGAELLGTTWVAFQPYTNSLVSYNSAQNQLSVSNPVAQSRYALAQLSPAPSPVQTSTLTAATSGFAMDTTLFGGLVVDAATNQAVVANAAAGTISLVNLGPSSTIQLKTVHVSEVLVPSASPTDPNTLGGIPGANFPQGTLTSATPLANVKIFGTGFLNGGAVVRLDGANIPTPAPVSDREIDVTIPASFLKFPHRYALDVVSGGVTSNATDFFVVKSVDLSGVCVDASNNPIAHPTSVAVVDQIRLQSYAPKAVVSLSGCNKAAVIDIAPQLPSFLANGQFNQFVDNATFGSVLQPFLSTGSNPSGIAVSPRFGLAVVANNSAGTVSVLDLTTMQQKIADVTTGSGPTGVAINEGTGAALIANTQQNTVSELNLGLLFPTDGSTPPTTLTATSIGVDTLPIAIAIDPDRGTNNNGLAVVTALALSSGSFPHGVLDSVDIGSTTPAKSTTAQVGSVTATPTGIVFDPSVTPTLFYAVSSGGNVVSSFNPDTGGASTVRVGINPTSLALNPQTGQILTVNTLSNTISLVDTLSFPFKTRRSYGLPGAGVASQTVTNQVAIDQFLNLAVIADTVHNRVLIFPMPN